MPEIERPVNMKITLDGNERSAVVPEEAVRAWMGRGWEVVDPEVAVKVAEEQLEAARRQLSLVRGKTPEAESAGQTPPIEDESEAQDTEAEEKSTRSARAAKASGGRK